MFSPAITAVYEAVFGHFRRFRFTLFIHFHENMTLAAFSQPAFMIVRRAMAPAH